MKFQKRNEQKQQRHFLRENQSKMSCTFSTSFYNNGSIFNVHHLAIVLRNYSGLIVQLFVNLDDSLIYTKSYDGNPIFGVFVGGSFSLEKMKKESISLSVIYRDTHVVNYHLFLLIRIFGRIYVIVKLG